MRSARSVKKQNGFGLVMLLIAITIVSFIVVGGYYKKKTDDGTEKESLLEKQLDAVEQAKDIKNILESRNGDIVDI